MKVRDRLKIVLNSKKKISNPLFIVGFQGVGMVGTLASQHLADALNCELIGHIESEYLPPIAILNNSSLTYPIRIYYEKKNNIIIISSEVPVSSEFAFEMSHDLMDLMNQFKSKKIIVLEGLVTKAENPNHSKIFGVPTNEKMSKYLNDNKVNIISNGAILGVAGSVLLSSVQNGFSGYALMAESHMNLPDASAASAIIKKLSEILNVKINTKELDKKGMDIDKKVKDIMSSLSRFKKDENDNSKSLYG
ncbi:MAG: PAC2 family protein [Candidatus Nanoarchaeia archaeon]|nr:PAC2 family protein [Candidatus Nanoarchaeia archaeon]MDD5054238.1 PAC2 family protein [Candidatus Nanoarchaeia archaeon]MDD5499939.1 PAC2 family protein [Candidatus Nanoarchaeia archaeon]